MPTLNLHQRGISNRSAEFNGLSPNIQCNILKAHARDHARLLCLQFTAGAGAVKSWLRNFASQSHYVVSALDQKIDTGNFKAFGQSKTVINIYLTAKGYEQLGYDTARFTGNMGFDDPDDQSMDDITFGNADYVSGMKAKSVVKKLNDPKPEQWEAGYNTTIHAMLLLADADAATLQAEVNTVKTSLQGVAHIIKEETGEGISTTTPAGSTLHLEHFGYADGVSQPRFFTEDTRSSPVDLQPLDIVLVKDPFTSNTDLNYGSFLVYRKLEQDVEGFNNKVAELAGQLTLNSNQTGKITKQDFAGALAVGRFKDGTPLVHSDIPLGVYPVFNDFKYEQVDRPADKCPFHAHIRKANPRGQGALVGMRDRFITRRGIPYGRPGTTDKKGLLFMCFQANLNRQFNFLQKAWANAPGFPPLRGKPGLDPLIGQGGPGAQSWPTQYGGNQKFSFNFNGFITMRGGEYFFAPSVGFLKNL